MQNVISWWLNLDLTSSQVGQKSWALQNCKSATFFSCIENSLRQLIASAISVFNYVCNRLYSKFWSQSSFIILSNWGVFNFFKYHYYFKIKLKTWFVFLSHNTYVCCCFCPPSHKLEGEFVGLRLGPAQMQGGLLRFGPCSPSPSWPFAAVRPVSAPRMGGAAVPPIFKVFMKQ